MSLMSPSGHNPTLHYDYVCPAEKKNCRAEQSQHDDAWVTYSYPKIL